MDPDPLGKDRRRDAGGKREQRGVPTFTGALDPVTLQALLQRVGGQVLPDMPARDQPSGRPGPLKLVAVLAMWGGLALSYQIASLPPSSAIIGLAGAAYAGATLLTRIRIAA